MTAIPGEILPDGTVKASYGRNTASADSHTIDYFRIPEYDLADRPVVSFTFTTDIGIDTLLIPTTLQDLSGYAKIWGACLFEGDPDLTPYDFRDGVLVYKETGEPVFTEYTEDY